MNTKALFAFGGGFAPKSIRKICTLHRYELEKLALSKLSRCFSPTQQTREREEKKTLNWRSRFFFFLSGAFCEFVIHHLQLSFNVKPFFWRCACQRSSRYRKLGSGSGIQGLAGQRSFKKNIIMHVQPFSTHTHTHIHSTPQTEPSPAMPCPCTAFCLQTELPWLALLMLIRAPLTLAFMVLLLWTQVQNPNIKRPQPFLSFDVISHVFLFFFVKWEIKCFLKETLKMKPLPSTYAATSRAVNLQRKNIFSLLHVSSDKSRKQCCRGGGAGSGAGNSWEISTVVADLSEQDDY